MYDLLEEIIHATGPGSAYQAHTQGREAVRLRHVRLHVPMRQANGPGQAQASACGGAERCMRALWQNVYQRQHSQGSRALHPQQRATIHM